MLHLRSNRVFSNKGSSPGVCCLLKGRGAVCLKSRQEGLHATAEYGARKGAVEGGTVALSPIRCLSERTEKAGTVSHLILQDVAIHSIHAQETHNWVKEMREGKTNKS